MMVWGDGRKGWDAWQAQIFEQSKVASLVRYWIGQATTIVPPTVGIGVVGGVGGAAGVIVAQENYGLFVVVDMMDGVHDQFKNFGITG